MLRLVLVSYQDAQGIILSQEPIKFDRLLSQCILPVAFIFHNLPRWVIFYCRLKGNKQILIRPS